MLRKIQSKTLTLILLFFFGSIKVFCQQSPIFSGLQIQVNALTTSSSFTTVVSVDTKVTEAAAANLITQDEFETLDARIRTIYKTSAVFSALGYGTMPNDPNHSVRGEDCVIRWHNTNPCQGAITITNGATVVFITEDDDKSQRIYRDGAVVWGQSLITVEKGSTLIMKGSKEHPLIIDGGAVLSGTYSDGGELSQLHMTTAKSGALIRVTDANSKIMASNTTFQNNYCNDPGSGIIFNGSANASFKTASFFQSNFHNIWTQTVTTGPNVGGAIFSCAATYQNVTLADESTNHGILMNHCHFTGNVNDNDPRPGENAKLQNGGSCFAVQGGTLNLCIKNSILESNFSSWHGGAIFWNINDGTLDLEGTTFTKNYAGLGGAVYVQGNLNLNNCTFTDNHAVIQNKNNPAYTHPAYQAGNGYDGCGGALYIQPSNAGGQAANCNLDLNNCIFDGNSADLDGGAILLYMVQNTNATTIHDVNVGITIDGTSESMLVQNNTAGRVGGALALTVANELMENISTFNLNTDIQLKGGKLYNNQVLGTFDNDRATFQGKGYGGGLFLHYAPVTIGSDFEIAENTSAKDGGALYVANGNVTANGMQVYGNKTIAGDGGGIYVNGGDVQIRGGAFTSNIAKNGGAIYVNGGSTEINGGEIRRNEAKNNGGAMYLNGDFVLNSGIINNNTANNNGGGVYVASSTTININGGEISENTSTTGNGGGFFLGNETSITLQDGSIEDNEAENGGAIYLSDGAFFEYKTSATGDPGFIRRNTASNLGGGIFLAQGTTSDKTEMKFTLNSTNLGFYDNTAEVGGDDIYAYGGGTTTINMPNVQSMNLGGYSIPGATLEWWEDYKVSDSRYSEGTVQGDPSNITRYRASRDADEPIWKVPKLSTTPLSTFYEKYLCLTLGFEYGKIEIRRAGLKPNENAIYEVKFGDGSQRDIQRAIVYGSDEEGIDEGGKHWNVAKVSFLPKGQYTVTEIPWTWYNDYKEESYLTKTQDISEGDGYIFNFENAHHNLTETPLHDEEFKVNILKK